ncbi:Glycosyl hydrolases family 17 [Legionella quinlivanii]|uniref:Endo-1,3-beta-glucanase btgC n=1 Tax=Legionella quinlivanii TaxID=45073 RepID=A0A0W0Y5K6_9GAMM|nr:glycosyl hydrolase family 17 protein [Legionella quinlivanii]KTD52268.1 Glycosyl hydrolases family 17 [Legionella quinlivanii]SEF74009.1 Glycosyl hydrolases family 17 [Legionella quinlivanii DSM 21216]STY12232.1 Glycosyl hydrolases family 17 [Legionella quinlivanii]
MLSALKKLPAFFLFYSASSHAAYNFNHLVGVDYQPNHYAGNVAQNNHDVFIVGNDGTGAPISNVYAELLQLREAGFYTVRSYQTTVYSWAEIIKQANALGMKVIYEAVIPQQPADSPVNGCPIPSAGQGYIPCAQATLNAVIARVGQAVFNDTVILVFAGHENYCEAGNVIPPCNNPVTSNVTYLTSAVAALQSTLGAAGLSTPVSSALISGNLVTPSVQITNDMITLVNSYSPTAPLAFDPYPFQWGVPPATAVWTPPLSSQNQAQNSLAWDYLRVVGSANPPALPAAAQQPFYTPGRVLMSAETGWATAGSTGEYACNSPGPCLPSVANAVTYYQALYQASAANFVAFSGYPIAVLAFEAYDEPNKGSTSAEGHYGLFDSNCFQKAAGLVPVNSMVANKGCQGFSSGSLLTIVGFAHPYTLVIRGTNPSTGAVSTITASSNGQPGPSDATWPQYLVFPGATITIRGTPSCTSTVQSIVNGHITFSGSCNCPNDNLNNCYY